MMSILLLRVWYILGITGIYAVKGASMVTTCPDTWTAFRGSCYLFGTETPVSFFEAEHFCQQHGGHLVHVDNADENAFIKNRLRIMACRNEVYWMGLTDERVEGLWLYYDTQTKPNFTNWDWNQPNDMSHHEDCARFDNRLGADFKWNDDDCNALHEPICEISEEVSEIIG